MGEGVGRDPHNGLPQHFGLVVNAFDGQEDLGGGGDSMVKTKGTVGRKQVEPCHVALVSPYAGLGRR